MTFKREKKPFLTIKKHNFSKFQVSHFSKGVNHGFGQKMPMLGLNPPEKCDSQDFLTFSFSSQKRFHFSLQSQ